MTLLLGVDGGATKTVALIADATGRVLGAGRSGSSDIHAEADPSVAVERVADAVRLAAADAGVATGDLGSCVFSLCGADWPEDAELYAEGLVRRLDLAATPWVMNDALGALRAGTPDGIGVSLVIGTGGAIGARGPEGQTWFSGMRLEPSGAVELGRMAYQLLIRGEYGPGPVPGFRGAALQALGASDVEELVHAITARGGAGERGLARLAAVLLEADHEGDPAAAAAVREHALLLAGYVRAAARRVGFPDAGATLVVTGGVLRHHCTDLVDGVMAALPDGWRLLRASVEPAYGALLLAADAAGATLDMTELLRTGPPEAFFQTL